MVKFCFSFLLVTVALAISGCGGGKIPPRAAALLEGNAVCESHVFSGVVLLSSDNADYREEYALPLWNPSTNLVNEATSKIESYLRQLHFNDPWKVEEKSEICARLPKTVCQAVGVTYEGHKAILLNCLSADSGGFIAKRWREHFIKTRDGGPHFWNIIYLPESGSFVNLEINGWA